MNPTIWAGHVSNACCGRCETNVSYRSTQTFRIYRIGEETKACMRLFLFLQMYLRVYQYSDEGSEQVWV